MKIDRKLLGSVGFLFTTAALLGTSTVRAADGFEKVRCDRPIVPALIGARTVNDTVMHIEARRKAIGLKHLGADEIDDGINTINWQICGREFLVLDIRNVSRDAIELPPHSRDAPAFSGSTCEVDGKKIPGDILGVLAAPAGTDSTNLPIKAAWRIDRKAGKLVPLEKNAMCSTDGIIGGEKPN